MTLGVFSNYGILNYKILLSKRNMGSELCTMLCVELCISGDVEKISEIECHL